jgi:hypothetical protein
MCEDKVYKNDIGTKIKLDAGSDISTKTSLKIKYLKGDGVTSGEWDAILEGTDYGYYITVAGDLDTIGIWKLQLYAVLPSGTWRGETVEMQVFDDFK